MRSVNSGRGLAREGEVVRLKPQFRALLAEQSFVLIYSSAAVFEPEVTR